MPIAIFALVTFLGLCTAIFSAVFGVAGGMMLFVFLSLFLNAASALPIHAVVQAVSNTSRVAFSWGSIHWPVMKAYCTLLLPGAVAGSFLYKYFDPQLLETMVAATILVVVHVPFKVQGGWGNTQRTFLVLGLVSGFLGMIIGVVGPLISPFFATAGLKKEKMVATKAACQVVLQLIKIPTFSIVVGDSFMQYQNLIICLCVVTIIGSWVGKNLIHKIQDHHYHLLEKYVLTILSLILIGKSVYGLFLQQ